MSVRNTSVELREISEAPIDWDVAWPADTLKVTLTPPSGTPPQPPADRDR